MATRVSGSSRLYAWRFRLVYLALIVLAGLGLGLAVTIWSQPEPKPPPPWSTWKPQAKDNLARVRQIASHIAGQYDVPGAGKMVEIRGGPLVLAGKALLLAERPNAKTNSVALVPGTTVEYTLCGSATNCGVKSVPASTAGVLMRRASYELALYTLKYVGSARNVVVFMPPVLGQPRRVLVVRRAEVRSALARPLRLPAKPPRVNEHDAELIALATDPFVYHFTLAALGQNKDPALVVDPVTLAAPKKLPAKAKITA